MNNPIKVAARWALHHAYEAWAEEGWGNTMPEVGEYDYNRICESAELMLPPSPTLAEYAAAYEVLGKRAEPSVEGEWICVDAAVGEETP